jgi:hypothetical protein
MKLTLPGFLVSALVALLPFVTLGHIFYGTITVKSFFVVIVALLLCGVFAYRVYTDTSLVLIKRQWLLVALLGSGGVSLCSALAGLDIGRSFFSDIYWASGLIFLAHAAVLAYTASVLLTKDDWSIVRKSALIGAGIFGFLAMLGSNGLGFEGKFLWIDLKEYGLSFGNETYAGAYLLLTLVFSFPEVIRKGVEKKMRAVLVGSFLLTALSPLLFNTGIFFGKVSLGALVTAPQMLLGIARASSATLFILAGYFTIYFIIRRFAPSKQVRTIITAWSVLVVVGVSLLVSQLFVSGSAVQNVYIKESTAARIIVWERSGEAIAERPFLGHGPENFNYAFEKHFDNRLFMEENLAEIWFERGHNIFIDTLVTTGALGLSALMIFYLLFMVVVYRAGKRGDITGTEQAFMMALVPAHVLQMQTGFDTIGSYTMFAVLLGYVLSLERQGAPRCIVEPSQLVRKGIAGVLSVLIVLSVAFYLVPEWGRQEALAQTFKEKSFDLQKAYALKSTARTSSFESLRLSSASFIQGALALLAKDQGPGRVTTVLSFLDMYEKRYVSYIEKNPNHYRARVNLAYVYLIETSLGNDKLTEARAVLEPAFALSPQNPLTPILMSLTELYGENPEGARKYMDQALALNPDIEFTQKADAYLKEQLSHPQQISVLKLINL